MAKRAARLGTWVGLLALCLPVGAGEGEQRTNKGSLIIGEQGQVGDFSVGKPIADYETYVKEQAEGEYRSPDGAFVLKTDAQGIVREITASGPGLVTERLIRPGNSTLWDVLTAYGREDAIHHQGNQIELRYAHLVFAFEVTTPLDRELSEEEFLALLKSKLTSITVVQPQAGPPPAATAEVPK